MKLIAIIFLVGLVAPTVGNPAPTQQKQQPVQQSLAQQKATNAPAIAKVVQLIEELMAKNEADGKAEQKLYDKFACWCEKTTARKAAAIEAAKAKIAELQALINELSGKLGTLGAEVAQLEKDVASTEAAIKEATEMRQKEQDEYLAERSDSEQVIGALEHAIKVLTGAGEGKSSALQEEEVLSVAASMRSALRLMPEDTITADQLETVKKFVSQPTTFFQAKTNGLLQIGSQNPMGDYAPASTQIQGIMKAMYDDTTSKLEESNAEEATKQKEYEELMATKKAELASLKATLGIKTGNHADSTKTLADSKAEREATEKQLKEDEKFFEETKAACKAKAMAWAERSRLRTEEMAGMKKAVEILTSEDAKASFEGAGNSFLQLRSVSVSSTTAGAHMRHLRQTAFDRLKLVVKKTRSLRVASLAAMLKSTEIPDGGAMDAFKPVVEAIDKMIKELRVEEQEDIEHRDFCESKENKLKNQQEDLKYKIGQTEGLIERLESVEKKIDQDIESVKADIVETEEAMAEALATRNEETEDFKKALKDDHDSAVLIAGAIEALTAFYVNNKLPLPASLMQKQPSYSTDPDKAPETGGIDEGYGGSSSESGGIITILKMLKEDLENEMSEAKKDEEEAAAEFAEAKKTALEGLEAQRDKQANLEGQKADTRGKITDADEEISSKEGQHAGKEEELKALAPNCEWLKGAFDKRREARKAEIDGLIQAKAVLQGAAPAMLQKSSSPSFLARA